MDRVMKDVVGGLESFDPFDLGKFFQPSPKNVSVCFAYVILIFVRRAFENVIGNSIKYSLPDVPRASERVAA